MSDIAEIVRLDCISKGAFRWERNNLGASRCNQRQPPVKIVIILFTMSTPYLAEFALLLGISQ